MTENELSYQIRGAAFKVHTTLGTGLLESVYETALAFELKESGLCVRRQVPFPLIYRSIPFDIGFRLDILVNDLIIIEIKSIDTLAPVHFKQVLTYLKLLNKRLGFLINFNSSSLDSKSLVRVVNGF